MTRIFNGKDFFLIPLPFVKVRVPGFQLQIHTFSAGFAFVVFKFDLAIDAPVRIWCRLKDLPGFAGNGESMTDKYQFPAFIIDIDPRPRVHVPDLLQELIRSEFFLD